MEHRGSDMIARSVAGLQQPVGLLGFGVEGRETLRFLLNQDAGSVNPVHVYDHRVDQVGASRLPGGDDEFTAAQRHAVQFHNEPDWEAHLATCATIFRSAGVRPDVPVLEAARNAGADIVTAVQIFLRMQPGRVAGVTGTLGKGTTVTLIGEALKASGIAFRLGGNIGLNPLAFVADIAPSDVTVLELSSFQLMDLRESHPAVAVVLRTTSEHLDWHRDVGEYRRAKRGLLAAETGRQQIIYCADSEGSAEIIAGREAGALAVSLGAPVTDGIGAAEVAAGVAASGGTGFARYRSGAAVTLPFLDRLSMPGAFNRENAAAAYLAAECLGAQDTASADAIAAFAGLPHRLEFAGRVGNVDCYNDSYATRPDATLGAIGAFDGPLALICGGSEKHADFSKLMQALVLHRGLQGIQFLGATAQRMATALTDAATAAGVAIPPHRMANSLQDAFHAAMEDFGPDSGVGNNTGNNTGAGRVLVMSPACASFDMFENYSDRGRQFIALVRSAMGEQ